MKKIFAGLFILICSLSLFACDFSSSTKEKFGFFTHNGYALTSFKSDTFKSFDEASSFVSNKVLPISLLSSDEIVYESGITESQIKAILLTYSSVNVITKYWEDGNDTPLVINKILELESIETMLKTNTYTISNGMVVKNIYISSELLTTYEDINLEFKQKPNLELIPFDDVFSYHKNTSNNFVLQTNDYKSISSEPYGGVNATFIQQNETLFNDKNLISKFQSSFGIRFQSPGDTVNQGTVFEVEFSWIERNK